jgi:iron-sulfur cluster repair protein YtfE (RIC family)
MTDFLDQAASKTMGGMKAAKATLEGLTGVFRHLAQEHGEVSALLMHVKLSSDPKVRAELFPKIRAELLSHEKGEVAVVYPALRAHAETQLMADKHDGEASQLEKVIDELTKLPVESEVWGTTFEALVDLVQRHVTEEETVFFPAGERVLGAQSEAMQKRYENIKAEAMKRLA